MIESINTFLARIGNYFAGYSTLPSLILGLILLGIVVMLITIVLVVIALKQGAKKKAQALSAIQEDPNPPSVSQKPSQNLPPLGGPVSEFLVKRGYFQVSDLSKSFFSALDFLRSSLNSPNYKYRLPWYLLIGAQGSGKTSLMEGSNLNLPVGAPAFGDNNSDCRWWFLNRGVILDIRGTLLLNTRGTGCNENGWRSLLILLSRYRAARPLNGIILTISAEELYGKNRLSMEEMNDRAQFLAHKLQAAQNNLGLRLPVYIVITKSDIIPGFQSLCAEIPSSNRQNIFGWSSPYNPTIAYSSKWIEEAFSSIMGNLNELRTEILASSRPQETRDGIFVLPVELMTLKEKVAMYVNALFKTDAYQESPLLRGIYFVGDSCLDFFKKLDMDDIDQNKEYDSKVDPVREMLSPDRRKIFFIDDLISEKIFYEAGLAKPLSGRILSINRGINIAKVATATFAVVGSIGLYNAYERFVEQKTVMMPVLQKMNTLLYEMQKIQINQPGQSTIVFETYAREFMDMMERMENASFFSVFVPASWFSPIRRDMNETLKISYQQIIVKTIYVDLIIKARELLNLRPLPQDHSESLAHLLKPLAGKEWALVKNYVMDLNKLETMIFKFNNLKTTSDPRDLDELVSFTFNSKLPQQFMDNYKNVRSLFDNMIFPAISLREYQNKARETLGILYQNYLDTMFNIENSKSLPARINEFLSDLSNTNNRRMPDIKRFRQFSMEMVEGTRNLGDYGQTWMDSEYFNPGKEYNEFFDALDANENLFGKKVSQYLIDQTAIGFENYKQQLKTLNLNLVGFKAKMPISPIQKQKSISNLSQGILDLAKALEALFNEPYMSESSNTPFNYQVPSGKMLRWDANMIDTAHEMATSFDEFLSKHVEAFPKMVQENLRLLARESLQANVVDLVARAQTYVSIPSSMSDHLQAEEILSSMISDVKIVSAKFVKLLQLMNQGKVGFSFSELRNLLANNYYWLLSQVEKLQTTMNPYSVRDPRFSWWDGKQNAALQGFAVRDQQDLQTFVDAQREQMKRLCSYAEPIVLFLASQAMMEAPGDKNLLNRWRRIVEQFTAAQAKQAGSTYSQLEEFILKTMNTYTEDNVTQLISVADIKQPSGDYFAEIIRTLKKGLLGRAEILKRQVGVSNYEKLIRIFNEKIRGKFPFVVDVNAVKDEVDPEALREFFAKYDEFGGTPDKILDQVYQLGPSAQGMINFLDSMNVVRTFIEPFVTGKADGDSINFDVKADFRVSRDKEQAANKLVDSFIQLGDSRIDRQSKSARWYVGQPVTFGFRYTDGDVKPVGDASVANYRTEGNTATFVYGGRWGLLRALKEKQIRDGASAVNYYVVGFNIPLTNGKTTTFNRVTLSIPPTNAKAQGKVVLIPSFPTEAPAIPEGVKTYMNQAALADGLVQPQEYKPKVEAVLDQPIPDVGTVDYAQGTIPQASGVVNANGTPQAETPPVPSGTPAAQTPAAPSATPATGTPPAAAAAPTTTSISKEVANAKNELNALIPGLLGGGSTPAAPVAATAPDTAPAVPAAAPAIQQTPAENPLNTLTTALSSSNPQAPQAPAAASPAASTNPLDALKNAVSGVPTS